MSPGLIHSLEDSLQLLLHTQANQRGAGVVNSPFFDLKDIEAVMLLLSAGEIVATGTLDAKFQQAQDAAGTGVKDITKENTGLVPDTVAIVQLGDTDDDTAVKLGFNVRLDIDIQNDFTHFRLVTTVANANVDYSAIVQGLINVPPDNTRTL